jgi:hypothetical protein
VVAKDVQIARPDVRLVRYCGNVVGVDQSRSEPIEPVLPSEVVEQRPEGVVGGLEPG